ncbi:MAG: response regulator, partial [Dehalococcoidia bacterium]
RAHEKGLELNCYIPPDVPVFLIGDPVRLRQVITNLIINAIKFTEKGEVSLFVENDPDAGEPGCLRIRVSDTGIGIPSEHLNCIFERFAQGDSSITREYGGTGLGLAICQRLAALMGGRIWVDSEVGKGSTFSCTVRLGIQAKPNASLALPWEQVKRIKALIVDDNATNRLILRESLVAWGASVKAVEDGYQALAELQKARRADEPYHLVMLDHRMPGMDGFELAERIKNDPGIRDVTIIMLTSDNRADDVARCPEVGILRYLLKPVKQSSLLEAINTTIRGVSSADAEPSPVAAPEKVESQGHPLRILLVEDSESVRLVIQSYLKNTPHEIDIAENGAIALDKFTSERYDIVLMDLQMPVMDGYTATRAIRKWERGKGVAETPIIALSAHALKEDTQMSLDAGCAAHVTKPIKKAQLMEAIDLYTSRAMV